MTPPPYEGWTPKLVAEALCEAGRWVRRYGGPVGPAGVRSVMPAFRPSLDDFLDEGWGLPETADDEEERPSAVLPSPERVQRHLAALEWPAVYLLPAHGGSALMLALWVRCKVHRASFDEAVKVRGTVSRGVALRMKDRALSIIAQGLERDGVRP